MNRKVVTWTIVALAALGLTGCAGTPTASEKSPAAQETTADQSAADACSTIGSQLSAATDGVSGIDFSNLKDPEGTLKKFNESVNGMAAAADSIDNAEVKKAVTAMAEDFGDLRDVFQKAMVEGDTSAAADLNTVLSNITESSAALQKVCVG